MQNLLETKNVAAYKLAESQLFWYEDTLGTIYDSFS